MADFLDENESDYRLQQVWEKMGDDLSREVYLARSAYSVTGDINYLNNVIRKMPEAEDLQKRATLYKRKIIFGAGQWGKTIARIFDDVNWDCFVDNNVVSGNINGIPIIPFKKFCEDFEDTLVVVAIREYKDITNQLLAVGISKNQILELGTSIHKRQYFDLPELYHSEDEVFVDAGGYDGNTCLRFMEWAGEYRKVFVFEPIPMYYALCIETLLDKGDCLVKKMGLSDVKEEVRFAINGEESRKEICDAPARGGQMSCENRLVG